MAMTGISCSNNLACLWGLSHHSHRGDIPRFGGCN
ncbi:rCG52496 [Rattus norvegicus]|uniref:RCG52496 n=1 Tax=Rattus norvegicus TaxID=10116 RepID=A6K0D0_RAT|nr:rCG52496 [Rattus norvegicus]